MKAKTREIVLDNGLTLKIDENAMDDMELLELLVDLDEEKPAAIPRIGKHLLGDEQIKQLYDSIRVNGRVPITKYSETIKEILDKLGETGKN